MATGAGAGWRYPVPAGTTSLTACAVHNVETKTGRRSQERDPPTVHHRLGDGAGPQSPYVVP